MSPLMAAHPFWAGLKPTLHISHRGGAALAPENTLAAFRRAVREYHTDMLELDLHLTRDGALVVFHDETLERCTDGAGRVAERSLAELEELDAGYRFATEGGGRFPFRGQGVKIPTFREVVAAFPGLRLNVELKASSAQACEAFAREFRALDAWGQICCGSEQDAVAEQLQQELPDACHFYPRASLTALVMAIKLGEPPDLDERFTVLDMPWSYEGELLVDEAFLQATGALKKWVNVWTVDDAPSMRAAVKLGVGGIITDRPDRLRAVLDSKGRLESRRP